MLRILPLLNILIDPTLGFIGEPFLSQIGLVLGSHRVLSNSKFKQTVYIVFILSHLRPYPSSADDDQFDDQTILAP